MRLHWNPQSGEWEERPRRVIGPGRAPMLMKGFGEVFSHADGQTYTSRKDWNRHLSREGMVEIGNERLKRPELEPPDITPDLLRAYEELS